MDKRNFLDILIRNSPEEINEYILKKGKKPKSVLPYEIIDKEKYKKNFLEEK